MPESGTVSCISPAELSAALQSASPPVVMDVRLEDDFACSHVPGAVGNCVFEVAFGERLARLAPDRAAAICVYGAGEGSAEAAMAAEKLRRAGYITVLEMREGIAGWEEAGLPVEGSGERPADPPPPAGRYDIDLEASRVIWTGRNLLNSHTGTAQLKSGFLEFEKGRLTGGAFVIDLTSLRCTDLEGDPSHDVLIEHLESDDFFDTAHWPEAGFVITSAEVVGGARPGCRNLFIRGDLTLRGGTHPVEFAASAGLTAAGKPAAQAHVEIDRTQWRILYGSGRWFRRLAGHLVNDIIELDIRIVVG